MKQFKKYCIGILLLMTLVMVTACGRANNGAPRTTMGLPVKTERNGRWEWDRNRNECG